MAPLSGADTRPRTLVLLRHAKADRPAGVPDADRPLTDRGHADAAAAGAWLVNQGYVPDLVLCSPSRRTRQTWHAVALALAGAGSPVVHYERPLYEGSPEDLLQVIHEAPPEHRTVLLIGHNPAISQLTEQLSAGSGGVDSDGLRTCGIAVHQTDTDWSATETAKLITTHTPRA
ncbi:histidine phosphatase family protein [Saccharothrix algeriensis]|uniref:Phosphohistidine phosphatase n=1 Tax=Catellatospora bangladeshensis TaxID=310355 RepID=A0A8J3JAF4_9ACTN|nr:histidine phosphatase family protein [Catellatospora bangladeshensis]GIF81257.1 phosphohistidine phosphatase [Catellatospora bangladeshensis]